ncbi:MAG: GNAT family protein [Myxococcales bacterium]
MSSPSLEKVVLQGEGVRLEPLSESHLEPRARAIEDGALWEIPVTFVPHPRDLPAFLAEIELTRNYGVQLAFATIDTRRGQLVGSTRFMNFVAAHRSVEIGFTFLAESAQRSHVNTEAKYLMLRHAFESWGLNRVELITDALNTKSRAAITRLGAKQEGILRSHMVMRDGRIRDSVLFGITKDDWPEVRRRLEASLL